ncbi:MAG: hypothetical protein IKX78_02600 [Clostridia bacterium]|nr:hypothetical protein [Clostridia bacterium]
MKEEIMRRDIGEIDDTLIEGAEKEEKKMNKKSSWVKWVAVAAALVALTVTAVFTLPMMFKTTEPVTTPGTPSVSGETDGNVTEKENSFEKGYTYSVDTGKYASYIEGKVIKDEKVGEKLDTVTVTAGWADKDGNLLTEEHADAEIYEITGVSADTAVAIKFLNKLEAQLTTCYYVIMNPNADLTPVQPYVITYDNPAQNDVEEIFE